MKKIFYLFLLLPIVILFVSCEKEESTDIEESTNITVSEGILGTWYNCTLNTYFPAERFIEVRFYEFKKGYAMIYSKIGKKGSMNKIRIDFAYKIKASQLHIDYDFGNSKNSVMYNIISYSKSKVELANERGNRLIWYSSEKAAKENPTIIAN